MSQTHPRVQGTCASGVDKVRDALVRKFDEGMEDAASFAALVDGSLVIDLWGGWADSARSTPWQQDTIVNMWSSSKAMVAIVVNMLLDRGLIDLRAPVAQYGPEFGQAGKSAITVSQLMSHQAALPDVSIPISLDTLYDWPSMVRALEVEPPWWEPGTLMQYQSITLGHLAGDFYDG